MKIISHERFPAGARRIVILFLAAAAGLCRVQGQVANSDFYSAPGGSTFTVPAPGVLANDSGAGLTAVLATGPANGALILNADGSFLYTPTNNFTGVDGFTYQAAGGAQTSAPANVDIMILAPGQLFHDTFVRPGNDGSIIPWTQVSGPMVSGGWQITNGLMLGTGAPFGYGYAYAGDTNWTDYSVEAQMQFSGDYAASAGILGRLDPVTGAHYAVWIYPEQSDEFNIPPVNGIPRLQLIKYRDWTNFTLIGPRASLAAVGTGWHTLKLTFQGRNILSYFDGHLVRKATDNGSIDGRPAYSRGSIGLNLWTSTLEYTLSVSNLVVSAPGPVIAPSPFAAAAGVYQGLLEGTNSVSHESSGLLNAIITRNGLYSARIVIGGAPYSMHGRFSAEGISSNHIARRGLAAVSVGLQLDLSGGGLTGQFSDGTWTAELSAFRAMTNPPAGKYTILLPSVGAGPAQPGGDGFGTATVSKAGRVIVAGMLGDAAPFAQAAQVDSGGQWPFYAALYSRKGSILGWLSLDRAGTNAVSGLVNWFKLAQPGKFYPGGFTNQINLAGSTYQFTNGVPALNFTNGRVVLTNGNLGEGFTNQVILTPADGIRNQSPNGLTLTINKSSGLFSGVAVNPASGRKIPIHGVLLQQQNFGSGVFPGTNQTGRVLFGPQ